MMHIPLIILSLKCLVQFPPQIKISQKYKLGLESEVNDPQQADSKKQHKSKMFPIIQTCMNALIN